MARKNDHEYLGGIHFFRKRSRHFEWPSIPWESIIIYGWIAYLLCDPLIRAMTR